ncbi:MAG TPA: alpha/beta hydrolase [Ktedonosporobacter sp.]|jgi:acetyl esterase/lipase|nr:alpha/beta hydrolase [Ktedonosporobacter sp.]
MSIATHPIADQTPGRLSRRPANRIKRGGFLYWAVLFTLSAGITDFLAVLLQRPQSGLMGAILLLGALILTVSAVSVVLWPVRRLLIAAGVVNGFALLFWLLAHTTGIPVGPTFWRAQSPSVADMWVPIMEGIAAFFFFSLAARTWTTLSRPWRICVTALPYLFLAGLLTLMSLKQITTALFIVALFTTPGTIPDSLQVIFLPAAGLVVLFLLLRLVFPRLRARTPRAWSVSLSMLPLLLITSLLSWPALSASAPNAVWFPASPASTVSAPAGQMTTLEYCHPGGDPLPMDLSEPAATFARPVPVVFYMHGGEGLIGNRQLSGIDGAYFARLRSNLLSLGFAVGSIDYRFPPLYGMLDQVVDAKCAVRFLRAHANELGINPQRIGVYGVSEGGYLSAMLGLTGSDAGFDKGQYLDQSSRVQAAVDMWGPTDLTDWRGTPSWVYTLGEGLGISRQGTALRADLVPAHARKNYASPVSYVTPDAPPFLIIQGADDWFIAPHHSQKLASLLQAAHVPTTLVMVQHDEHGLAAPTPGQVEQPSPDALIQMIQDFFVRTLAA